MSWLGPIAGGSIILSMAPQATEARAERASERSAPVASTTSPRCAVDAECRVPAVDAVGSDEAPLPAPPPPPGGRLTRGPFVGRGWVDFGVIILRSVGLPRARQITTVGVGGSVGWRFHPAAGLFTGLATWVGNVETAMGFDEDGMPVSVQRAVPIVAWDLLGLRGVIPLRGRLEPSAQLASGIAIERRPSGQRQLWGAINAALRLGVAVAPMLSLQAGMSYRLLAHRDARRHYAGGDAGLLLRF